MGSGSVFRDAGCPLGLGRRRRITADLHGSRAERAHIPYRRHVVPPRRAGIRVVDGVAVMRAVALILSLAGAATAAGQSIGANVSGVVVDESGGWIPRATVTITNAATGRSMTTTAGAEGDYRLVALLPGAYDIAAVHDGFAPAVHGVTLLVGS